MPHVAAEQTIGGGNSLPFEIASHVPNGIKYAKNELRFFIRCHYSIGICERISLIDKYFLVGKECAKPTLNASHDYQRTFFTCLNPLKGVREAFVGEKPYLCSTLLLLIFDFPYFFAHHPKAIWIVLCCVYPCETTLTLLQDA